NQAKQNVFHNGPRLTKELEGVVRAKSPLDSTPCVKAYSCVTGACFIVSATLSRQLRAWARRRIVREPGSRTVLPRENASKASCFRVLRRFPRPDSRLDIGQRV